MSKLGSIIIGLVALAAFPAHAYTVTNSAGNFTTTPGATTFATFDAATNTSIGTVSGGVLNTGANPGSGQFISAAGGNNVVINLTGFATYFGLLWGTNDGPANQVHLFNGLTEIGTGINGNGASAYTNITAVGVAEQFNRVELVFAGSCCFETDNFATILVASPAATPEPSTLLLAALGLGALVLRRRKQA